jgi:hypothetical protein
MGAQNYLKKMPAKNTGIFNKRGFLDVKQEVGR